MAKKKNKILSADDILSSSLKTVDVNVPEWGGSVRLTEFSFEHRQKFSEIASDPKTKKDIALYVLAQSIIDEDGNALFDEKSIKDLSKKNGKILERLFVEASKLNGLDDGSVEREAKN